MKTAIRVVPLIVLAMFVGCWEETAGGSSGSGGLVFQVPSKWSEWSEPVNLGAPVYVAVSPDFAPCLSKDGLSLFFTAGAVRGGGFGAFDLWVSQRANTSDSWGLAQNLGSTINTTEREMMPTLSPDEHRLYFASNRLGGSGNTGGNVDIYVSHRQDKKDDFGWETPVNLGSGINSDASEESPLTLFENEATGEMIAYFASNRRNPTGVPLGDFDIYTSVLLADGTFGPAAMVEELSLLNHRDRDPAVRKDGLEMFLASTRPGGSGGADLWVTTRASTSDPWSDPVNLGSVVNSPPRDPSVEQSNDNFPALSNDGTTLYFASAFRPGNLGQPFDIWVTTRTKLK